jgi:hypothetical protein
MDSVSVAILDRLEDVVTSLQDNSIKMGQLLAVHQEKLAQQEKIDDVLFLKIDNLHKDLEVKTDEIKKGCERDIMLVKKKIDEMEKKMYIATGAVAVLVFFVTPFIQNTITPLFEVKPSAIIGGPTAPVPDESSRFAVRKSTSFQTAGI